MKMKKKHSHSNISISRETKNEVDEFRDSLPIKLRYEDMIIRMLTAFKHIQNENPNFFITGKVQDVKQDAA